MPTVLVTMHDPPASAHSGSVSSGEKQLSMTHLPLRQQAQLRGQLLISEHCGAYVCETSDWYLGSALWLITPDGQLGLG